MIALMTSTQKSPIRILFVEDDEEVRSLIEEFLTDAGHEVDTADTVAQGYSLFDTRKEAYVREAGASKCSVQNRNTGVRSFRL